MEETPKCVDNIRDIALISLQCTDSTGVYINQDLVATLRYRRDFSSNDCYEKIKKAFENYTVCLEKYK